MNCAQGLRTVFEGVSFEFTGWQISFGLGILCRPAAALLPLHLAQHVQIAGRAYSRRKLYFRVDRIGSRGACVLVKGCHAL